MTISWLLANEALKPTSASLVASGWQPVDCREFWRAPAAPLCCRSQP
jgi:hypothetical protein